MVVFVATYTRGKVERLVLADPAEKGRHPDSPDIEVEAQRDPDGKSVRPLRVTVTCTSARAAREAAG